MGVKDLLPTEASWDDFIEHVLDCEGVYNDPRCHFNGIDWEHKEDCNCRQYVVQDFSEAVRRLALKATHLYGQTADNPNLRFVVEVDGIGARPYPAKTVAADIVAGINRNVGAFGYAQSHLRVVEVDEL